MSTAALNFRESAHPIAKLSLLQRIAEGDRSAVAECIDQYSGLLWYLARRYCPTQLDAEDAVQEIFIEIWQKASSFDPKRGSEETFLTVLARRRLIDRRRRQGVALPCVTCAEEQLEAIEATTENGVELEDEAAKAAACMDKLSAVQRSVLTLNICQGHSQSTVAELLKLPVGTVKSFARRGLIFLRDCMSRPAKSMVESRSV